MCRLNRAFDVAQALAVATSSLNELLEALLGDGGKRAKLHREQNA
jgi:hypothetical protein